MPEICPAELMKTACQSYVRYHDGINEVKWTWMQLTIKCKVNMIEYLAWWNHLSIEISPENRKKGINNQFAWTYAVTRAGKPLWKLEGRGKHYIPALLGWFHGACDEDDVSSWLKTFDFGEGFHTNFVTI